MSRFVEIVRELAISLLGAAIFDILAWPYWFGLAVILVISLFVIGVKYVKRIKIRARYRDDDSNSIEGTNDDYRTKEKSDYEPEITEPVKRMVGQLNKMLRTPAVVSGEGPIIFIGFSGKRNLKETRDMIGCIIVI